MARKDFEIIDHTADAAVIAYGADLKELFCNAALALFSLVTDPESIRQELQRDVKIISEDKDSLLVEWLNELIYLFDAERILFSRFDIERLTNDSLKASCYGENVDPLRHRIRVGVKAATYHMLKIDKDSNGYKVQIIFDV